MNDFFISINEYFHMFPKNTLKIEKREELVAYVRVMSLYRHLLNQFILKNTKIKELDQLIKNSPHGYKPVKRRNYDIYQSLTQGDLRYLYPRSNIFLESLTQEEKGYLVSRYESKNYILNPEDEDYIKSSISRAINPFKDGSKKVISYGPEHEYYNVPSDALVLGIRFHDKVLLNTNPAREEEIGAIMIEIDANIEEILGLDCYTRQYTQNGVIRKNHPIVLTK